MKELKYQELKNILERHDVDFYDGIIQDIDNNELATAFKQYITDKSIQSKAVLGMDLYRYGSMKEESQNLVPLVGQILRDEAIELCLKLEPSIFQDITKKDIEKNFINTGDGGYFIFDTPLHALIFAIYFELTVRLFNSYRLYPKLRSILDQRATLRYAMTYDKVYKYENNYYGPGIITNARILGRDKLDRFLIDENVYDWFMRNTNGIDNLQIFAMEDIKNIEELQHLKTLNSKIFPSGPSFHATAGTTVYNHDRYNRLNSIDIQKIGEIGAKNTEKSISIYNLHIQYSMVLQKSVKPEEFNNNPKIKLTVSLGNLNTSGISEG